MWSLIGASLSELGVREEREVEGYISAAYMV